MIRRISFMLFLFFFTLPVFSDIIFSEESVDFGLISKNGIYSRTVTISNNSEQSVSINISPLCSCIEIDKPEIILYPDQDEVFQILLNTEFEYGETSKRIEIRTDYENQNKIILFVYAEINIEENSIYNDNTIIQTFDESKPDVFLFYSKNCISCIQLIKKELGNYISDYNIKSYDLLENLEMMNSKLDKLDAGHIDSPVLIFKNSVLQGEDSFIKNIRSVIIDKRTVTDGVQSDPVAINLLTSIIGGLGDGVNPCAFSTLIFLLSALAYIGKRKKEVLLIGLIFSFTIFLTYFLIGLGVFRTLLILDQFIIISCIIKWILLLVLIVFAGLSLVDYILILKGKTGRILLQLPKYIKKRIHQSIRIKIRSTALVSSTIALGFLVSVFELGCTGQIYFPYITSLVSTSSDIMSYFYLLVYNISFIIPLFTVFVLSYKGLSNDKLTGFFKKHTGLVKLVIFMFFLILALITFIFNYSCFVFTL